MFPSLQALRAQKHARRFFTAYAQSALGTGISLVALPLVALARYDSPTAVSFVLLAEFLPLMLFASFLGALSDRLPRRRCLVGADVVRCAALLGVVLIPALIPTVALAALAGAATGVWRPAAMSGLSELGDEGVVTALYGTLTNIGRTGGALVAGLLFALIGAVGGLAIDAATFAVSAAILATIPLGNERVPASGDEAPSAAEPPAKWRRSRELVVLAIASASVALTAGVASVAEPVYVSRDLGAGATGFALVIAAWGLGAALGSWGGAAADDDAAIRRRFALAIGLTGIGFCIAGSGLALPFVLAGFALNGIGNGAAMVHERLLVRRLVDERHRGAAFGFIEGPASWAFAIALTASGVLVGLTGAQSVLVVAGLATLAVCAASFRLLFPHSSIHRSTASCPPTVKGVPNHALGSRLVQSPAGAGQQTLAPVSGD